MLRAMVPSISAPSATSSWRMPTNPPFLHNITCSLVNLVCVCVNCVLFCAVCVYVCVNFLLSVHLIYEIKYFPSPRHFLKHPCIFLCIYSKVNAFVSSTQSSCIPIISQFLFPLPANHSLSCCRLWPSPVHSWFSPSAHAPDRLKGCAIVDPRHRPRAAGP